MAFFADYLVAATREPNLFFNKVDNAKPTTMPHLQYMKIALMSKLHKTTAEAMDTTYGEAIYDIAAIGEGEGNCNFVTDEAEQAIEIAKRKQQQRMEANGQRN